MPRQKKKAPTRANGMYEYKATIGKDMHGKAIRKSFYSSKSLDEAKEKAKQYMISQGIALKTGEAFIIKDYTFAQWAGKWLTEYKQPFVTENTFRTTYEIPTRLHLIPYFGEADMQNIKNIDIQAFFHDEQAKSSESMLKKCKLCLTGIFESAIENDIIFKSPAKHINFCSAIEKHEKRVYSDSQIEIAMPFFLNLENNIPEAAVMLSAGLRRGEALGLMWTDIDLENSTLSVNRSIVDKKGGGIEIRPPKWNSYRTIPITAELIQLFLSVPHNNVYVFPNINGDPQKPTAFSDKLKRAMKRLNALYPQMDMLTSHELRHTHGTALRRAGVDIYTIQKLMGHKDINVTANIYVHDDVETTRKAAKIV